METNLSKMIEVIGDRGRRRRYDPNLAEKVNAEARREKELEEKGKELGDKVDEELDEEESKTEENQAEIKSELEFVHIPQTNILISRYPVFGKKDNLSWEQTHYELDKRGLFMPTPSIIMGYLRALNKANSLANTFLFDENDKVLYRYETNKLCEYFFEGVSFDGVKDSNFSTWVDAKFIKNEKMHGALDIVTDHRVVDGKLEGKRTVLERCLDEEGFATLNYNSQGLLIDKSVNQNYATGMNIRFAPPKEGRYAHLFYYNLARKELCFRCDFDHDGFSEGSFGCKEIK